MYKVSIKRYGFLKWDGHQNIRALLRQSMPTMSDEEAAKVAKDNMDFMSTLKTLKSTANIKASEAEAAAGLSWITEIYVTDPVEANAIKEYFGVTAQKRLDENSPNAGLLNEVTVEEV